ncbi:MAG: hypothetical protein PUF43_00950, partial [Bacteroidales bacterium]|nr:hypothetical protein [Bacteroidales bacterium]
SRRSGACPCRNNDSPRPILIFVAAKENGFACSPSSPRGTPRIDQRTPGMNRREPEECRIS